MMDLGNKRKRGIGVIGKVIICVIAILLAAYAAGVIYFQTHFLGGTEINGVGCSFKSVVGAENSIADVVQNYTITLKGREGAKEQLNGKDFSMDVTFDDSMNDILETQNVMLWPISFFSVDRQSVGVTINYDEEKLKKSIEGLECMDKSKTREPVDASLSYNSETKQYEIVAEDVGNTVIAEKLHEAARQCVEGLEATLVLEEQDCYENPKYTAGDKEVEEALTTINQYVATEVTYDYTTDKVEVTSDMIAEWLQVSKDFEISFDKEKMQEFVSDMAAKHDTIFTKRKFQTSYGYTIEMAKGDYGWWTNRVEERKDLVKFIKAGKAGEKEPVYYQKAAKRGKDDLGDTYVEVNLTRQHVLLYKDGKLIKESDCVSGKTKSPTPAGIYSVTYKDHSYDDHQVALVGEDYSSDVAYFIPFNGNVGFHDASWRRSFGGSQYKQRGSHGCVNLPYAMAEEIYNTVEKGMPVIVYEDPGVPSATTEAATTEEKR